MTVRKCSIIEVFPFSLPEEWRNKSKRCKWELWWSIVPWWDWIGVYSRCLSMIVLRITMWFLCLLLSRSSFMATIVWRRTSPFTTSTSRLTWSLISTTRDKHSCLQEQIYLKMKQQTSWEDLASHIWPNEKAISLYTLKNVWLQVNLLYYRVDTL